MIPAWASEYVGLPFREAGRGREGLDCWGLYLLVRAERWGQRLDGLEHWYNAGSSRSDHAAILGAQADFLSRPVTAEVMGDAVFLRLAGLVSHIGMVLGGGLMLHVLPGADSCIESYTHGRWAKRVEGFRRP